MSKTKIIFTLPDLSGGGAERVMSILLKNLDKSNFEVHLVIGRFTGVNSKTYLNIFIFMS